MRAALRVEAIGHNSYQELKLMCAQTNSMFDKGASRAMFGAMPANWWCAKILGRDAKWGWQREFVKGYADYSESNGKGSRGVYIIYTLDAGCVYEVKSPVAWGNTERYFCRVNETGEIIRIPETEVERWLANTI